MNILKKTVLGTLGAGLMSCAAQKHIETGVVIYKEDIPEEKSLLVSIDNDDRDAERKLFFDMDVDSLSFLCAWPYDIIKYTNNAGGRFPTIGNGDRVISINGESVKRMYRVQKRMQRRDARRVRRDSARVANAADTNMVNDVTRDRVMRALEQTR